MNTLVKKIIIVGGGSAGWLTAGRLASELKNQSAIDYDISLIESPDVKPIGVGEGTWPTMRSTLKKIGISETDFIKSCGSSFKQGSKFIGWKNGLANDYYYHPFTISDLYSDCNLYAAWKDAFGDYSFGEAVSIQTSLCETGLAPKLISMQEYSGALNYGYHLDAGKFSDLLKNHCINSLGVNYISDHVVGVNSRPDGDIESLSLLGGEEIYGDLFVDCSGSKSLLIGDHYKIEFISQKKYSINDCAIAIQVPYEDPQTPIASATLGVAQKAGWIWDIGLSNRRGVGYVFSSAHLDIETAEKTLREYVSKSVGEPVANALQSRTIAISAGYRAEFWHKNCVAVGMASGFIEPLEASALAMVELSANMIVGELPVLQSNMSIVAKRFNDIFRYRWQRIIEFLKLHYVLSQRRDSDYWYDMRHEDSVPDGLKEQIELWRYRAPYFRDLLQTEELFPSASYQFVMYGMGFETLVEKKKSDNISIGIQAINENFNKMEKYKTALSTNRELIDAIANYGFAKI